MPKNGILQDHLDAVLPLLRISDALSALARGRNMPEELDDSPMMVQAE